MTPRRLRRHALRPPGPTPAVRTESSAAPAAAVRRRLPRRRLVRAGIALLVMLFAGLLVAPGAAALPIPGLPDGKDSPTPEVPGRGVVGFFESTPTEPPPPGDPWAPNSTTTIYEQYGYAGLRFNTYDLGVGPDIVRSPDASIGTSVANWLFTFPKAAVAATGAVVGAAFQPDFLGVFDPLITNVVETLRTSVFEQWIFLTIAAVGLLLMWRARHASLASSAAAVGWALFVLVLATLVFRWPLAAGNAADETVTTTLGAVSGGLNGTGEESRSDAGMQAMSAMHEALLYQAWLGGTFGDANAEVAQRYGADIFDSQALTWREAQILRDDPARGRDIIEDKQGKFSQTAEKIAEEDPDAYEYLTGQRSDTRVGYAILAGFAALCAVPFLLVAGLLVLGSLIVVRFGVMLFPAFATLGLFPTMRGLVTGIGNTMAAALINAVVFGIGAAVTVKGIGVLLSPESALAPWLDVVLVLLLTVVMWVALRPFRRLSQMVSRNRNHFGAATGAAGSATRGAARAGGRILTTALGTFLGYSAANRGEEQELKGKPEGVPQRAEATTIYAEHENENAPTVGGPVTIQAGTVTVTQADTVGAGGATAGGASLAGAAGGGGGGRPGGGRSEGMGGGGGRTERTPVTTGSDAPAGRGGSSVVVPSGSRTSNDSGGRFEAGGGAGGGSRPARPAPARGGDRRDPVDLSDYDFDELADIFRPEPTKPREQPRQPVRPNAGVEAGRGR
jgi:hypothetical protein